MASDDRGSQRPSFLLTQQQQSLLFAALNSNRPQSNRPSGSNGLTLSPSSFGALPIQSDAADITNDDSSFLDSYTYEDVGDSSFDFSLIDDQPRGSAGDGTIKSESTDPESHEKRSHPDDEEEDDGTDHKRRDSSGKVNKKPGRKPLTSEPTSKRKAQNRAAQRAFRERKEKHLKDLETQVDELTKASEEANHENSKLRAQVERMTTELNQYKQRLALMTNQQSSPKGKYGFGSPAVNNMDDINFQFNFPKFGSLPGPKTNKPQRSVSQPISPQDQVQTDRKPLGAQSNDSKSSVVYQQASPVNPFADGSSNFVNIYTPSMSSSTTNESRASLDSANLSHGGSISSPSTSSNSNAGPSSSCGTSPEPYTQSPLSSKPIDTLTTIGEEQFSGQTEPFAQFANIDFGSASNFDWLAQQNGGTFEPQLSGAYREPQDNILSNPSFDDFFNDAFDADFITPYNVAPNLNFSKPVSTAKPNLIDSIDAQKDDFNEGLQPPEKHVTCTQLWEKLRGCEGDFDLDGLCSELTKKAKCTGNGPVVNEKDFDSIMHKFVRDKAAPMATTTFSTDGLSQAQPNGVTTL